jgi:DNA-binding NtrC family response regulator
MRVLMTFADEGSRTWAQELAQQGGELFECTGPSEVLAAAHEHKPDVVLLQDGHSLPELTEMVAALKAKSSCMCVLVGESYTMDALARATQSRADALLVRPVHLDQVTRLVNQERKGHAPKGADAPRSASVELVGDTIQMREVCRRIATAAGSNASVLITGETGVGKELVAEALHRLSPRRDKPFVAVSCAALPETLVESEIFGHERGAFTGATEMRRGRFELADGGTLFLDEVGELKEAMQVKLLRVLQERVFERVGGTRSVSVDVRVVAATNRLLTEDIAQKKFRADLFYRLNVLNIHVPPLRERQADIMPLWRHLVERASTGEGRKEAPVTAPRVAGVLLQHHWPGNIRELDNVAQHAVTMAVHGTITLQHLPAYLKGERRNPVTAQGLAFLGMSMQELERAAVIGTYEFTGSAKATAEVLGISIRKVHYRLKQYKASGWSPEEKDANAPAKAEDGTDVAARPLPRKSVVRKTRVLLAEDDDELRWALEEILTDEGYDVMAVRSGAALQEQLRGALQMRDEGRPYDVIVSDLRMPGSTGLDVLASSRAEGSQIPMILMSAFGDDETRARAMQLGAAAFIGKPLKLEDLHAALHLAANGTPSAALTPR